MNIVLKLPVIAKRRDRKYNLYLHIADHINRLPITILSVTGGRSTSSNTNPLPSPSELGTNDHMFSTIIYVWIDSPYLRYDHSDGGEVVGWGGAHPHRSRWLTETHHEDIPPLPSPPPPPTLPTHPSQPPRREEGMERLEYLMD
jgi:hypothetical protein